MSKAAWLTEAQERGRHEEGATLLHRPRDLGVDQRTKPGGACHAMAAVRGNHAAKLRDENDGPDSNHDPRTRGVQGGLMLKVERGNRIQHGRVT